MKIFQRWKFFLFSQADRGQGQNRLKVLKLKKKRIYHKIEFCSYMYKYMQWKKKMRANTTRHVHHPKLEKKHTLIDRNAWLFLWVDDGIVLLIFQVTFTSKQDWSLCCTGLLGVISLWELLLMSRMANRAHYNMYDWQVDVHHLYGFVGLSWAKSMT